MLKIESFTIKNINGCKPTIINFGRDGNPLVHIGTKLSVNEISEMVELLMCANKNIDAIRNLVTAGQTDMCMGITLLTGQSYNLYLDFENERESFLEFINTKGSRRTFIQDKAFPLEIAKMRKLYIKEKKKQMNMFIVPDNNKMANKELLKTK